MLRVDIRAPLFRGSGSLKRCSRGGRQLQNLLISPGTMANFSNSSSNLTTSSFGADYTPTFMSLYLVKGMMESTIHSLFEAIHERGREFSVDRIPFSKFGLMLSFSCSAYGISLLLISLVINRVEKLASTSNVGLSEDDTSGGYSKLLRAIKKITIYGLRFLAIGVIGYNLYRVLVILQLLSKTYNHNWQSLITRNLNSSWLQYDETTNNQYMRRSQIYNNTTLGPGSDIYWPIFLGFCLSVFVESLISTTQGTRNYIDTSMSLFEVASALHECSGSSFFLVQNAQRPTEFGLMICLFQCLAHLNVHLGDLINKNRLRLLGLTIVNLGFIFFVLSYWFYGDISEIPVIIFASTLPHILMLFVVVISVLIFIFALLMNGFNLRRLNFGSLLLPSTPEDNEVSSENVRGLKALNLNLDDDFLTALLGIGLFAVALAGKSSYITELRLVVLREETWIESSIWESLKAQVEQMSSETSGSLPSKSVLNYLRANKINGYANIIVKPSKRLLSGDQNWSSNNGDPANLLNSTKTSILRKRNIYLKRILGDFFQLLVGITGKLYNLLVSAFRTHILRQVPKTTNRNIVETDEEFELRRLTVPQFLRLYVTRKTPVAVSTGVSITKDWDDSNYASLLQGQDISEFDDSEDYQEYQEYSESDFSDIESIDVSRPEQDVLPINELMTSEGVTEFFQESIDSSIFKVHMNNDKGIITRSKFKQLVSKTEDETSKLIELILHKRSHQLEEIHQGKDPSTSGDSELTQYCVICQCNPREIITWPCRCFAICEDCRISLVSKGMEGCVCCRREVEGISKIFVP